jgi:thiamine biosynthesis protein ThiI
VENLAVTGAAATLPIFRPLIGMDKDEIIDQARRLGTYDISIEPDQDCCTLFTPRHPVTRAIPAEIAGAEATLPIDDLVAHALRHAVAERLEYPGQVIRSSPGQGS